MISSGEIESHAGPFKNVDNESASKTHTHTHTDKQEKAYNKQSIGLQKEVFDNFSEGKTAQMGEEENTLTIDFERQTYRRLKGRIYMIIHFAPK